MERNLRKERIGLVVTDKMDKTVVVEISDRSKHPLYKKTVTKTKRLKAHDEENACGVGDKVESSRRESSARTKTGELPKSSRRLSNFQGE